METSEQKSKKSSLQWLWLALVVLVLDLYTKHLADTTLAYAERMAVFPGFDITLLYNRGAAFSFLSDAGGWQRWLFVAIAVAVSTLLVVWLKKTDREQWWLGLGLALILGGALGNLHDRILLGYVVDFISVYYDVYHFPAFNLADSAITVGAVIMIIDMIFLEKQRDIENLHGRPDRRKH